MPAATRPADTIRVLVATDNHVGYMERDPRRGNDAARTFHEIMCLAKEREVDLVLLAGDLFHDNKPSRKSMVNVIRSIRMNCFGDKPIEFEIAGDQSAVFSGVFNYANFKDENLNVSIPIFSIHGNHDDPSGEGYFSALDVLSEAGLINYYGRTPESDNIQVRPVTLKKGSTNLALFGISNVRDERLFRTFQNQKVRWFCPDIDEPDKWFNLLSVHQNHYQRGFTDKNNIPEHFLSTMMDLVVWGHEHECKIEPRKNLETGFHVMQPGSSVATSLIEGEAVQKHVAILSICGKSFTSEKIPLKTVRPFVYRDIKLASFDEMQKVMRKTDNKDDVRRFLRKQVEIMIIEANSQWQDLHKDDDDPGEPPLPLIRLRVDYTAPDGCHFDVESGQRFSAHFADQAANTTDIISFTRKKTALRRIGDGELEKPELANVTLDNLRVEKLVREYLASQALTILPQNKFGDAVQDFVASGDKGVLASFIDDSLSSQVKHLLSLGANDRQATDQEMLLSAISNFRTQQEAAFASGEQRQKRRATKLKPKPANWDSDLDGAWEDQLEAREPVNDGNGTDNGSTRTAEVPARPSAGRTTGRGRGTKAAASSKSAPKTTKTTRGRKQAAASEEDEAEEALIEMDEDEDFVMISDGEDAAQPAPRRRPQNASAAKPAQAAAKPAQKPKRAAAITRASAKATTKQTQLNFSQASRPSTQTVGRSTAGRKQELSDDVISDDDDDAFESAPASRRT